MAPSSLAADEVPPAAPNHANAPPDPMSPVAPLSWEQEQIWLHAMLFPELPLYNETAILSFRGELNLSALEASLQEIARRHPIWRTTFQENTCEEARGVPCQVVGQAVPIKAEFSDLSSLPAAGRDQQLEVLVSRSGGRPFDLTRGPLLRVLAVRYAPEQARIFLTLHHLIFDGASLRQIVLPELVELYAAYSADRSPMLPAPPMQYAEYARRQRAKGPTAGESTMDFWRSRLAGFSPLTLPADRPRGPQATRSGAVHGFRFEEPLSTKVLELARRERTTPFTVLLASFIVLLARTCATEDVTLGTTYGGRNSTELEGVLGCFLNTVLLRTDLSGDPNFRELLRRVREVTLDAFEHAGAPFQEVVRQALPKGHGGESPIQAVFSFQPPAGPLADGWDLDVFGVFHGAAKFDLHLEIEQRQGGFRGRLMYSTALFDGETIAALLRCWLNLIRAASTSAETCVWKLPLLDAEEQNWLLHSLNATGAEFPLLCMHDLFARQAAETPDRIALSFGSSTLTYSELEAWSADIAARLRRRGIAEGSVVGLMIERSPAMLAGMLGILRAGAAYVPLDPTYPPVRLHHMINASKAALLLTQPSLGGRLPEDHPPLLHLEEHAPVGVEPQTALPAVALAAPAYVIFTSGSTGAPKGVEVSHRALVNLLHSMREAPGIAAGDVLLAVTSISFDIAGLELFLPLIAGARVDIATVAETADAALLARRLIESGATILQATPATWRMLVDSGWSPSGSLKILCGGEALPLSLARQLLERSSSVWNLYGPTETTIWSARARLDPSLTQIPLGEPIANTGLYILDAHQHLVPPNVAGELYIGGAGLAEGYRDQPELTRERFLDLALEDGAVQRLYRTGDRVKRLRDGTLLFLGRTDRQVKLRGFRIELGEIEQALNALAGVQESIVLQVQDPARGEILAGFVLPAAGATPRIEQLRSGLAATLPGYMVPAVLNILEHAPLTLNGKLDRTRLQNAALPEPIVGSDPPHPGTEQTLAALWCDLLGLKSVGRQDNFFDLGGHSLLAVRFVSLANRAFDGEFRLASFLQAPTIAQFAQVVSGQALPATQLLKRGTTPGKQLLWIGGEPWLTRLARHLSDELSLYTITPDLAVCGLNLADDEAVYTIEMLAAQALEQVRALQPNGPYLLAGFCLRSLLAYEVAQRLRAEGQEVALLVLGDLYAPGTRPRWPMVQRVLRKVHRECWNLLDVFRSPGPGRSKRLRRLGASWIKLLSPFADAPVSDEMLQALYSAELRYRLTPYTGKVLFLQSREGSLFQGSTSGTWLQFLTDVEIFRYAGIHEGIVEERRLARAAEFLERFIDRALSQALSSS